MYSPRWPAALISPVRWPRRHKALGPGLRPPQGVCRITQTPPKKNASARMAPPCAGYSLPTGRAAWLRAMPVALTALQRSTAISPPRWRDCIACRRTNFNAPGQAAFVRRDAGRCIRESEVLLGNEVTRLAAQMPMHLPLCEQRLHVVDHVVVPAQHHSAVDRR